MFVQQLVSRHPELLASRLRKAAVVGPDTAVRWVSPLESDDWAEYRDGAFLKRLGRPALASELKAFWPARGPQWDALGVADETLLLVEAKAHVGELASTCTAEAAASLDRIRRSLDTTKRALGAEAEADWLNGYYQLANRLAHLRFLLERGADAWLVLLQFTGATGMPTASTREAYETAFADAMRHLGLENAPPLCGVAHVYVDVGELAQPGAPGKTSDSRL